MQTNPKTYIEELTNRYSAYTNEQQAKWSKKYLRNQFEFLGIRTPVRRKLTNQFLKDCGLPAKEQLKEVVLVLWQLPEREYQQAALDILGKMKNRLGPDEMPWLTELIVMKSWWDTIDVLSPHIIGSLFQNYPELIPEYADHWIESENIWLQRSAILFQLKYKVKADEERLTRFILRRADSDEFFIQKAIGWILREYAKTNPDFVISFVSRHSLKPLTRREALKHLS
ncbi:DNA alkylation repair protein [Bacillus massiliglaciei]|uniref:DNA alkylation repair protein n=1 Tax=Bacillus massiliglaciei TaxID=1816693 RepID=UPI000A56F47C|nr:DNA alkylation repair protein [Bacillus massiliglaciei]